MGVHQRHPEKKLLVEGVTDLHFIAQIWKKQMKTDVTKHFSIVNCEGKDKLVQVVADYGNLRNNIWKTAPTTHLGIVVDADESAASTLQSVSDALKRSGHSGFPSTLEPNGLIHTIGDLKIGVWIMPDNNRSGMAEDLFLTFLPGEIKPQRIFAEKTLDQLEAANLHGYKPDRRRSKALTHTVLAWQAEPGARMGEAIRDNYVTLPTEKLPFIVWLSRLFS